MNISSNTSSSSSSDNTILGLIIGMGIIVGLMLLIIICSRIFSSIRREESPPEVPIPPVYESVAPTYLDPPPPNYEMIEI